MVWLCVYEGCGTKFNSDVDTNKTQCPTCGTLITYCCIGPYSSKDSYRVKRDLT